MVNAGVVIEQVQYRSKAFLQKYNNVYFIIFVYFRVLGEITQFREGLNSIGGLYEKIVSCPDCFRPLFTNEGEVPLTFEILKSVYKVNWSERGSNSRFWEEETIYAFESFLLECEFSFFISIFSVKLPCLKISVLISCLRLFLKIEPFRFLSSNFPVGMHVFHISSIEPFIDHLKVSIDFENW